MQRFICGSEVGKESLRLYPSCWVFSRCGHGSFAPAGVFKLWFQGCARGNRPTTLLREQLVGLQAQFGLFAHPVTCPFNASTASCTSRAVRAGTWGVPSLGEWLGGWDGNGPQGAGSSQPVPIVSL